MPRARPRPALNAAVAGLLQDLAEVQPTRQQRMGYGRAAMAVLGLDEPLEALVDAEGTLRKIPGVGPSSTRIIREVLETGTSATVARALAATTTPEDLEARRGLREGFLSRAEVLAALRGPSRGPSLADYRGDLQMHSTWSDGRMSLADIVEACSARGYRYCAVTDHGYGLPVAHGVSMADLVRQHRDIDAVNAQHAGRFRLLKGIEANIRGDGTIDMADDELARLEIVVAAPHSALRQPRRPDGAHGGRRAGAGRSHPRPPARPEVRGAAGRQRRLGSRVRGGGAQPRRHRDRRRPAPTGPRSHDDRPRRRAPGA